METKLLHKDSVSRLNKIFTINCKDLIVSDNTRIGLILLPSSFKLRYSTQSVHANFFWTRMERRLLQALVVLSCEIVSSTICTSVRNWNPVVRCHTRDLPWLPVKSPDYRVEGFLDGIISSLCRLTPWQRVRIVFYSYRTLRTISMSKPQVWSLKNEHIGET